MVVAWGEATGNVRSQGRRGVDVEGEWWEQRLTQLNSNIERHTFLFHFLFLFQSKALISNSSNSWVLSRAPNVFHKTYCSAGWCCLSQKVWLPVFAFLHFWFNWLNSIYFEFNCRTLIFFDPLVLFFQKLSSSCSTCPFGVQLVELDLFEFRRPNSQFFCYNRVQPAEVNLAWKSWLQPVCRLKSEKWKKKDVFGQIPYKLWSDESGARRLRGWSPCSCRAPRFQSVTRLPVWESIIIRKLRLYIYVV